MGKLMHPQLRATSAAAALVESRDRSGACVQADDWLARGWNPFKGQESPAKKWHESNPTGIERMRDESSIWIQWMWDRRDKLRELAPAAFERTASGKLDMGGLLARAAQDCWGSEFEHRGLLDVLLHCGADPEAPGRSRERGASRSHESAELPPLFEASREGAKKLIEAGARADAPELGEKWGKTCWEAWGLRAARGQLPVSDLDWMAERCAPSPGKAARLPIHAARLRAFDVVERLEKMNLTPADFGLEGAPLAGVLREAMSQGDMPEAFERYAKMVGWTAIFEAMGRRGEFEVVAPDKARLSVEASPLAVALACGRVKTLGVLEREGFLGPKKGEGLAALCASAWRQARTQRGGCYGVDAPRASGLVWALARLGKGGEVEAQKALAIAASCARGELPRAVESCAAKGWLPDSGPLSARELFKDGQAWGAHEQKRSFQQFMAVVEEKSIRSATGVKKAAPAARGRRRL